MCTVDHTWYLIWTPVIAIYLVPRYILYVVVFFTLLIENISIRASAVGHRENAQALKNLIALRTRSADFDVPSSTMPGHFLGVLRWRR